MSTSGQKITKRTRGTPTLPATHGLGPARPKGAQRKLEDAAWPFELSMTDSMRDDLLANLPVVFYSLELEPSQRFTFVSENVKAQIGRSARELTEDCSRWTANIHDDDRAYVLHSERLHGCHSRHALIEYRLRHANGHFAWIRDEFLLKKSAGGQGSRRVGFWIDISKRKSAELAFVESEQRLQRLLAERERLSRDLHDGIVQAIYAVGLGLEEARRVLYEDRDAATDIITQAIESLNIVIREVRQHIVWSGPQALSPEQLRAELSAMNRTLEGANRLRFRFDLDPSVVSKLPVDAVHNVLQIVREAMSNSLRHSNGRSGLVSLRAAEGAIRLVVEDDGIGFDPARLSRAGLGLKNIRIRANELGARLSIDSRARRGTVVTVDIPASHVG